LNSIPGVSRGSVNDGINNSSTCDIYGRRFGDIVISADSGAAKQRQKKNDSGVERKFHQNETGKDSAQHQLNGKRQRTGCNSENEYRYYELKSRHARRRSQLPCHHESAGSRERGGIVLAKTDVGRQEPPAKRATERYFALKPEEFRIVFDIQKNQKT
jgi:hypothetical protein